ncbi:TRIC cation channel family protein [Reyranella sp.]|uniref:TRIC cation channel family protein n=1 Tax=Reyranella sp. TaxID=1929291 RepID=UPI003D0AD8AE
MLLLAPGVAAQTVVPVARPSGAAVADTLRGGWYPWDPYQYQDFRRGVALLTGFDIEIERAIARIMGLEIDLPLREWEPYLAAIAAGTADIAAGATKSEERERYAYFSKPYRTETNVLIVRRGASARLPVATVDEMLEAFAKQKFRLGVIGGYVYADKRINTFIADPANKDRIVAVETDSRNLQNLLGGVIDGFLADRVSAATTAWRRNEASLIEEHPLRVSTDIHFMLSRASQTPERVGRIDAAIDQLKGSGEFHRIARVYVMPVLTNQTIDTGWFRLLVFLGTVAFALSGVLLAHEGRYTVFAAMLLAVLPAVGGGIVRDLLLQREPIGIVRHPDTLLIVFGTVLAGMLIIRGAALLQAGPSARHLVLPAALASRSIEVTDAVGLAAFTVTGVVVVLDAGVQPLWLWGPIAAVLTSAFGGLMRDLFRHDRVVANLRGELYAEIAFVWGLAFALFLDWEGDRLQAQEIAFGVAVTVAGAFLSRMIAISHRTKGWRFS